MIVAGPWTETLLKHNEGTDESRFTRRLRYGTQA